MNAGFPCRNCLSLDTKVSGDACLAPFFAKRVLNAETESLGQRLEQRIAASRSALKRSVLKAGAALLGSSASTRQVLEFRSYILAKIRICRHCGFIGPNDAYPFEMLRPLYADYRSDTYNADRCAVEPGYAAIMDRVGKSELEIESRLKNVGALLDAHADVLGISSVLDWGGGEGRFVPPQLTNRQVTVLDVSTEPLVNARYARVDSIPVGQKFDFAQVCHVLEHVSEPYQVMEGIVTHVRDGGYLYIEVPQDRTDQEMLAFEAGVPKAPHVLHEHINLYNSRAVAALGNALGLVTLSVSVASLDAGWASQRIVSGLFRKGP